MATTKKTTNTKYDAAVAALLKEAKQSKQVTDAELAEKLVKPFALQSDAVDELMQKFEDSGISIVDDKGEPAERALKSQKNVVSKKRTE